MTKLTKVKLPKNVVQRYADLLSPADVQVARSLAHAHLKTLETLNDESVTEAWLHGILNVLLMRGLLKPLP